MPIFTVGAAGTTSTSGYEVANSLRFKTGSSKSLSINAGTSASTRTFTYSFWTKRALDPADQEDYLGAGGSGDQNHIQIRDNHVRVRHYASGHTFDIETAGELRDASAWYHIVVGIDTTQGTDTNRLKIYVNGVQQTSFTTSSYPGQNFDFDFLQNGTTTYIGRRGHSDAYELDCYIAEVVFIDGTQLDATSFGEFDSGSGIWIPKDVSGLTFGNAGFHLDFENAGSLGADVSGNGNNFTVNNMTSVDQSIDTCTNNYATLNPLTTNNSSYGFGSGNLDATSSTSWLGSVGTIGLAAGKWYWEVKFISGSFGIGIGKAGTSATETKNLSSANNGYISKYADGYEYFKNFSNINRLNNNSSGTYGSEPSANDIMMVAFDADNGTIWVGKQGTWFASATQTEIENGTTTNSMYSSITMDDFFLPSASIENGQISFNFGAPIYSISSSNSDGNGHGNFEYAVPSGYYAINSKNLAEFG